MSEVLTAASLLIMQFLLKKKKKGLRGQLAKGRKDVGRNFQSFHGPKGDALRGRGLGFRDLGIPLRGLCGLGPPKWNPEGLGFYRGSSL